MNTTFISPLVLLVIGLYLFYLSINQKKRLDSNDTIDGVLVEYKRFGKKIYPIIEFVYNGTKKTLKQCGVTNFKLIKQGEKVRVLETKSNKFITDYTVILTKYYAISFIGASILVFIGEFYLS